jgi:hypothetical protein
MVRVFLSLRDERLFRLSEYDAPNLLLLLLLLLLLPCSRPKLSSGVKSARPRLISW